jgi:hypothetical protein
MTPFLVTKIVVPTSNNITKFYGIILKNPYIHFQSEVQKVFQGCGHNMDKCK